MGYPPNTQPTPHPANARMMPQGKYNAPNSLAPHAIMKRLSLNTQILIGCLIGCVGGLWLAGSGQSSAPLGQNTLYAAKMVGNLFLDLLRMVLVPLVFTSIACGVANLRAHDQMHRVWTSTLLFFFATMAIAIVIGFGAAHLFRPGEGLHLEMFAEATRNFQARQMALPEYMAQFMRGLFQNPFKALAQGEILAIVIAALFLGIALVVGGERYKNIRTLLEE